MQTESDSLVNQDQRNRIWFFPSKFWAATKGMPAEEVNRLMAEVESYAEAKNVEALKKYPFVFVGDPYKDEPSAA